MKKFLVTLRNSAGVALALAFGAAYLPHRHAGHWVRFMPHWSGQDRLWAAYALALGLFVFLVVAGTVVNRIKASAAPQRRSAPAAPPRRRRRAGAY